MLKKVPYKIKLVVFVQIAVFIAISAMGVVTYKKITGLIQKEMGMRAEGVALAASYLINQRMPEYTQLSTVKDEKTPFYLEIKKHFQAFKASNKLRYMYTERQVSKDKIIYLLDAEPANSEEVSHIGDTDDMNELRRKAYASKKPEYGPLTDDPVWGKFITGYAPLTDPQSGQFMGLIGVDIEAAEVFRLFAELKLLITVTIMAIMVISLVVSYKMANLMARPLYLDGMTGTYNHKYFQETMAGEIAKAERTGGALSMLMLDLDYFKQVNDTYGHRFGDLVLAETARIIKSISRKEDTVARYGGEEFAIILPGVDSGTAYEIACRIRAAVEQHIVHSEEGRFQARVTISIGVAGWASGMTKNGLIDRADLAMYLSKRQSRNIVTVYTDGMLERQGIAVAT